MSKDQVAMWRVDEAEFPAWLEACGEGVALTFAEYTARIEAAAAAVRERGCVPVFVGLTVAEMLAWLAHYGLVNDSPSRAAVALAVATGQEVASRTLGIKIAPGAIGYALIKGPGTAMPGPKLPAETMEQVRKAVGRVIELSRPR